MKKIIQVVCAEKDLVFSPLQELARRIFLQAPVNNYWLPSSLLLFSFLFFNSPFIHLIYNSSSPVPVCSHRGSVGSTNVARTSNELQSNLHLLFKVGVVCFDVDLSELKDGTVIVGHPSSIEGVVSTSSPSVLTLFAFLRQTYPYTSATLELKGTLRDNPVFVKKLEEDARSFGIVDKIAVEGQPLSTGKSSFLKEFVALRDRAGKERGAYCGLPADWIFGSKATDESIRAVYQSIEGVDIILPSALCFAEESVKLAISKWLSEKKGLHDDKSSQPLIQPWVFDSQESAKEALSDGGLMRKFTKVISNEPILLARALRS